MTPTPENEFPTSRGYALCVARFQLPNPFDISILGFEYHFIFNIDRNYRTSFGSLETLNPKLVSWFTHAEKFDKPIFGEFQNYTSRQFTMIFRAQFPIGKVMPLSVPNFKSHTVAQRHETNRIADLTPSTVRTIVPKVRILPGDITNLAMFLSSDQARMISRHNIC